MNCSGSPTISIAADARTQAPDAARRLAYALVFQEVLKPVAAALGPIGDLATGTIVQRLATRDEHP